MLFAAEPSFQHGRSSRIGILLTNLGTPAAPTTKAVRRYLAEFLSDSRVVEIPSLIWKPILHGIILRTRPAKSAANYAKIWTEQGSPLLVYSLRQKQLLQGWLGERLKQEGLPADLVQVALAMRYGQPSIAAAVDELIAKQCDRLLVLPLYPQYASSTTGSTVDALGRILQKIRYVPALRVTNAFHDHPGYIRALVGQIDRYWQKNGQPDRLLLSFHGLPKYTLERGDPYFCHCQKTARLLSESLGWDRSKILVAFQSRFGRTQWLEPYTENVLKKLAQEGVQRVDVFCPGFVADCLETLEEIALAAKAAFIQAGGRELHAIPCMNDHADWINALTDLVWQNLQGWFHAPGVAELQQQSARARQLGASS